MQENQRDASLIAGAGNGHLLQYSYLGNPMDTGAWQATVHGVAESDTTEHTYVLTYSPPDYSLLFLKTWVCDFNNAMLDPNTME